MMKTKGTTRRSFLKSGAIVAAPIAVVATPAAAAAIADDGSKAKLARLEAEREIEALNRAFLRKFNAAGAGHAGEFFAGGKAPELARGVTRLALDPAAEPESFAIAEDGNSAAARYACTAEFEHALEGNETIVQMARLQGNGAVRRSEARVLKADYVKSRDGWTIDRLHLA